MLGDNFTATPERKKKLCGRGRRRPRVVIGGTFVRKNLRIRNNAPSSRQPLVKGERLVRSESGTAMLQWRSFSMGESPYDVLQRPLLELATAGCHAVMYFYSRVGKKKESFFSTALGSKYRVKTTTIKTSEVTWRGQFSLGGSEPPQSKRIVQYCGRELRQGIQRSVPLEDTLFHPQRLCRAILPALFPAWVSPRFTIRQMISAYANSTLQD